MRKPLLRWKTRNRLIIALALGYRFGCPMLMLFVPLFSGENLFLWLGICSTAYALYSLIGYKLRWKHIFCAHQCLHRKEMTPDNIRWGMVRKSDLCAVIVIFGVLGLTMIVCHFLFI